MTTELSAEAPQAAPKAQPEPGAADVTHNAQPEPGGAGVAPIAEPEPGAADVTHNAEPGAADVTHDAQPEPGAVRTLGQRARRAAFEWLVVGVCALGLALVIEAFLVQAFSIPSLSMEPTLVIGDRVMVYKLGYRLHAVNRGDVVVFSSPDDNAPVDDLIKRVIAVSGETFELRDGSVHIDGRRLDEPYLALAGSSFPKGPIPGCDNPPAPDLCVVPKGTVLVLGDNREFSRDGRFFGPIEIESVVGRAFMKYWPPNDFGGL